MVRGLVALRYFYTRNPSLEVHKNQSIHIDMSGPQFRIACSRTELQQAFREQLISCSVLGASDAIQYKQAI